MAQTPTTAPAADKTTTARKATEKTKLAERISQALYRWRYVFWSIFAALAIFLVGYFVYTEVFNARRERSALLAEEAATQLEDWKAAEAGEKRDGLATALEEKIGTIVRKYPRQYAAQRARMIRASLLAQTEKWEAAAVEYLAVADGYPRSYLAPIALWNAAVAMENAKNESGALEAYGRIVSAYSKSYLTPRALYSRGRLYESTGDVEKAKADYTSLSDNHSGSSWTSLAKNRILALEIRGR